MSVPPLDAFFGTIITFILDWLIGALIVVVYNIGVSGEDQYLD